MDNRKPPLIAHVIFRLDVGGLENGLVNLINGLPADRFRHVIICIDDFTEFRQRIQRDDVEIIAIRKKPGTDPSALWRLYRVFRRIRPDVVHTRNLAALDALLPAFLAGVRVRIHSEHGWDVNDLDANNKKLRLLRKLHSPLVNRYIAVSRDLAAYLIRKVDISESRITQIYNGVDTDRFRPGSEKQTVREGFDQGFTADSILIGTVGRLQPVKNQLLLVNAFDELVRHAPELKDRIRLVIIGDGELREKIIQTLENAGLAQQSWVPGARDDVPAILQALDVFVLPSLAEGISNTVLEAMASALPVVATDVGGNPELVQHGLNGAIVPRTNATALARAIEEYARDASILQEHGRAGRKRAVELFSISSMLNRYSSVYEESLASR